MTFRSALGRISPLWIGIAISGFFLVVLIIVETIFDRWGGIRIGGEINPFARVSTGVLRDVRIAIVHCLLIGYLPAAFLHVLRSGRRTVLVLQGALSCTREECETLAATVRLSTRWLLITGLFGLTLGFLTPYMSPPVPLSVWDPSTWSVEVIWHRILGPLVMVWMWWLGYSVVTVSARLSRLARKLQHVDLLDLSALAPFTRLGLTNALLVVGVLSISSLMLIETGLGATALLVGGPTFVVAVLALLLPVRGVHQRIRQSKDEELRRINDAIEQHRGDFDSPGAGQRPGMMADMVAYRGLIVDVPEWPFTTSTYMRLIFYMLIPVVSWGLGIFAETILGRIFL